MRYISTFSGIEAASVAWEPLGWEPVAFCEIDEFPSAVLAHHYPDVPNLGDITKVDWKEVVGRYGAVDVVVGGSPCQSFSLAGGRESLDGESRLMFEFIRACDEIRSPWILWENVPAVLNTKDNAFGQLIDALQDIGYVSLAWRVLDAQFFGVAQRRRRVFLVGHIGDAGGASAAILFDRESVRGNTQSSREKRQELARAARGSVAGDGGHCLTPWDEQHLRVFAENGASRTLTSGGRTSGNVQPTVLQSAGFCGYASHTASGIGYSDETAPTLKGNDWQSQVPDVLQSVGSAAYAMRMREGKAGGGKGPLVQTDVSGTIATGNDQTILCMASGQACAPISANDTSPTLTCLHEQPIVCMADATQNAATDVEVSGTLKVGGSGAFVAVPSRSGDGAPPEDSANDGSVTIHDGTRWMVRRLTPAECERLQGFPDGWTDVPYRGKEHPTDTPRYKALGNSMAVPVMRWIGERIQMVDEIIRESTRRD